MRHFLSQEELIRILEEVKRRGLGYQRNFRWAYRNWSKLVEKYPDHWLAVSGRQALAVREGRGSKLALEESLRTMGYNPGSLVIVFLEIDSKLPVLAAN